jgi:hypothetical protein
MLVIPDELLVAKSAMKTGIEHAIASKRPEIADATVTSTGMFIMGATAIGHEEDDDDDLGSMSLTAGAGLAVSAGRASGDVMANESVAYATSTSGILHRCRWAAPRR